MITEHIDRQIPIDALAALSAELASVIGAGYGGCSGRAGLDVRLPDDATDALRQRVRDTVLTFNLNKRTPEQIAYQELMRVVEQGRERYTLKDAENDLLRYLLAEITLLRINNS